ncbi:MAG: type II toxin-antitoxin system VapC family toxin [Candidatus Omnitrophica bacterium]|nr:type II toxin-antitoxin system VapC family toxin [Candidatus Omnitrophota bacterium]
MIYFLDTDICIYFLRGDIPGLADVFRAQRPDQIKIPAIVAAELFLGGHKSRDPAKTQKAIAAFLEPFEIIPFDLSAAETYAQIRENLETQGNIIGPNDLLIAATALSRKGTLITRNLKEFSRVPLLKIQDWII